MRDVLIGQTDYTVLVKIVGTTGNEVTGLTNTDIDIAYARVETDNDVTSSDVTPASLSALTDAHSDWGFKEVSSTDHPGLYRLDIADAVFASGAWEAVVTITDASGEDFYSVDIGFRLVSFNAQDGVRLGLTALPNAAADAAGGLPISDAGGLDLDNRMPAAAAITNINTVYNTDFATNYNTTVDAWNVNTTHAAGTAWGSGAITAASIASDAITAAKIANGAIDAATFAADVDAEILSYLVDDATRIDASALNTLSGHDPGATLGTSTLTQAQVTGGAYALDTDANGRVRIVDGTGAGELATTGGYLDWNASWDTEVQSEVADALAAFWTSPATLVNLVADQVWEEAIGDHDGTAGSTAESLSAAGSAGDPWNTTLPGAYSSGKAGYILGTFVTAAVATATELAKVPKSDGSATWNNTALASIQSEANDALVANNLDHLILSAVDTDLATTVHLNSVLGHMFDSGTSWTYDRLSDSMEGVSTLLSDVEGEIASLSSQVATVDGIVDQILADTGTDGVVVNATGLATDAVQEIRNAITGGAYALSTDASGMVRIVDGTGAGELNTSGGYIAGIAGTINTLDALDTAQDSQHSTTQAAIAALNNLSAAQVNAEVDTALSDWGKTGFSLAATGLDLIVPDQPSALPAFGSTTLVEWNAWFAAWSTNPVKSTSGDLVLRNAADNTTLATHPLSDDGTTFISGGAA